MRKGFFWLAIAILLLTTISALTFGEIVKSSLLERTRLSAESFATSIRNDLLGGLDASVYEKCKLLLQDPRVLAVSIISNGRQVCDLKSESGTEGLLISNELYYDDRNRNSAGSVDIYFDNSIVSSVILRIGLFSLFTFFAFLIILALLSYRVKAALTEPIASLLSHLNNGIPSSAELARSNLAETEISEIGEISERFIEALSRIEDYQTQELINASKLAYAELAEQVAHDIRSPMAALTTVESGLEGASPEARSLLSGAISRIRGITRDLQIKHNANNDTHETGSRSQYREVTDLAALLETLVIEKRAEHRNRTNVQIELKLEESVRNCNIFCDGTEFGRVISNLINNGIESLPAHGGSVTARLYQDNADWLSLKISDTGKGIPSAILAQLGNRGATFEKANGSGLGLYHAGSWIRSIGGTLTINSTLGVGTEVHIRLPRTIIVITKSQQI